MRGFLGCNSHYSVLYEKNVVCSEKEKRNGFLQNEKVDPELHLHILLQFSVPMCDIIIRTVPSSRTDVYKTVYSVLNACCCYPVYRIIRSLLPQLQSTLLKYFYLQYVLLEKNCYFSSFEGTCREILDLVEEFCRE